MSARIYVRAHALVNAVGKPQQARSAGEVLYPGQRIGMQAGVAARGAQDRPGRIDRLTVKHAFRDNAGQVGAEAADLAHRRDAGVKASPSGSARWRVRRRSRKADPVAVEHQHAVPDRVAIARDEQTRLDPFHDPSSASSAAWLAARRAGNGAVPGSRMAAETVRKANFLSGI
jgi:hypothetical protein